ncbi:DUF4328 domain-containing protein [Nonomuraea sp. SMC257]|uniref:DUF4328 domain-containing protein n=1 Tax=Nonomuraea montanisoli TaxID=2741721 RepID=A0A7Y6M5L8_9ACTN|nr:DUF4328 domain-containing protein [Nonomuraea montanisoli]NUW35943.1 DUF4328 domain-containing protein [Nonomuraea montanisoli]
MARGENNVRYAQAPPTRAASAVYASLAAQILCLSALVTFELVRGRSLAAQLAAFDGRPRGAEAEAVVGAVTLFAVLILLLGVATIACAAAYTTWLVRARHVGHRHAPSGPVAAAWLIPGVNLVAPVLLVDALWRGSLPPDGRRRRWLVLLAAWWASWLTTLALVTVRLPLETSGGLTGVGVPELVALSVAALLCAATVREITAVQCAARGVAVPTLLRLRRPATPPESAPLGQAS